MTALQRSGDRWFFGEGREELLNLDPVVALTKQRQSRDTTAASWGYG
jgi:hypothetical protein